MQPLYLVNLVRDCFPNTPAFQCKPHIIRKFMMNDKKGNGSYATHLTSWYREWMKQEAEPSVRSMHLCKTRMQRDTMLSLTKEKWEADGESKMANTFEKTYIDNNNYNQWWFSASGYHGCVPCNNGMERHNLFLKGSPNFLGQVEIGRDMYTTLTREFFPN